MLNSVRDTDLQLLRLFVTVAECGGFSAAQDRLNITQSTISTQMAKLESRLGFRLCERGRSGFSLTPKGAQILSASYTLFDALEDFRHTATRESTRLVGTLRIGVADNLVTHPRFDLPRVLAKFRQRDQAVQLHIDVQDPAAFESLLLNQKLHLAISYFCQTRAGLHYRALFDESEGLYCSDQHPLCQQGRDKEQELAQADWVKGRYGLSDAHYPPGCRSSASAEQVEATLYLILSGQHIGYLPDHFAAPWVQQGRLHRLAEATRDDAHTFSVATKLDRRPSEVMRAFLSDFWAVHSPH